MNYAMIGVKDIAPKSTQPLKVVVVSMQIASVSYQITDAGHS